MISAAVMASGCVSILAAEIDITKIRSADGFRYVIENDEIVITGYDDTRDPQTSIPSEINSMPVTRINSLWGNIQEIIVPDSVRTIDSKAFKGNYYLENVVIPESVTEIGDGILSGCEKLKSCTIEADINEIPTGTFSECTQLSELSYLETIEGIGASAFLGCSSLKNIDIPEQMTEIPYAMLSGCTSLEKISIPDGVIKIGDMAFKDCSLLTQITNPEGVCDIGKYAFAGCSSVTALSIPDGVNVINNGLFDGCTSLSDLKLPDEGVSYEENNTTEIFCAETFRNCSSLREIVLPYGIQDIGQGCFDGCTSLENIYIPDTVETIDNYAFRNCSSLNDINIPGYSVVYGNETFAGCSSLTGIIIPETVYSFAGGGASRDTFKGCSSLKIIYLPSSSANEIDSFDGCDSLEKLYIGHIYGSFYKNHLGYIYDQKTDTYSKNEKLTIYCREDTPAQKYAVENGFNYETVDGVESRLVYFATFDDPEDIKERHIPEWSDTIKTFINGEGEFRVSETDITMTDNSYMIDSLQNNLHLLVDLGFDTETYSDISAQPTYLNYDVTDLSEIYDDIVYEVAPMDDGFWYMAIICKSNEGNDVTERKISGRKINIGFNIDNITVAGEEPDVIQGDLNNDGTVNVLDLISMKKYLLKMSDETEFVRSNADLNNDGIVNIIDCIILKSFILQLN